MNKTLHIIPLRLTPHSDRTSILQAYSRESGAVSFAIPEGNGRLAARRRALLQPLTPLEVEASIRPGRDVHTFREPRALMALHSIMASPERRAVAMFTAEVLQALLRQGDADALTFDYIVDAIGRLNNPEVSPSNFHLTFLIGLAVMLGISPDPADYRPGRVFDMIDGRFRPTAALHGHTLSSAESAAAAVLLRINWTNMERFRMSAPQRAAALERILEYYTLHYANLSSLKSPSILREVLR